MKERRFAAPTALTSSLYHRWGEDFLKKPALSILAEYVKYISDHFQIDGHRKTPWENSKLIEAYALYFHPLNTVRLQAVFYELKKFFPSISNLNITDFGSGLGATELALNAVFQEDPQSWTFIEENKAVVDCHRRLRSTLNKTVEAQWLPHFEKPSDLLVASYSLNETSSFIEMLADFKTIVIVEPSTRTHGRNLMRLRAELIQRGYSILAPCTHQGSCPLLIESKQDWCHDRIFFEAPPWFKILEEKLPMRNDSVTFSYLIATREQVAQPTGIRVIGDTLKEKGKTRQLICRGEHREFFSWLKRHGEAPFIPRGSVVHLAKEIEKKGIELRLRPEDLES